jgi:elongation factor G
MDEDMDKINKVRNIGLVAHIDAGKTTTTERILYYTGRIHRMGEVHDGNTTTDWMIQERERGITITSAATYGVWNGYQISIIDTPGHVDFTIEVERSLRVLDGCVVIFDAVNGVEPQSETVWRQAERYNVPRLIFVNKFDRPGVDFDAVIAQIKKRLMSVPLILQLPYYENNEFVGVMGVLDNKIYTWNKEEEGFQTKDVTDKTALDLLKERYSELVEHVAEFDEQIMHKYVHAEHVSVEELKSAIRKATILSKAFPVFCGSSLKNKGVELLLDGVVDYLPAPTELPPVQGENPDTKATEIRFSQYDEPFSALAFKIQVDPFVGKLTFVRVYSGKISSGDSIYNVRKNKHERISRILRMHANDREIVPEACAGEIVAIIGLKYTTTGETLCDKKKPILLESMNFPEPVIRLAIEPKTKQDQDKLGYALQRLTEEDPSLRVEYNDETNQTILSGMGELHLEIIVDRIKREFNVMVNTGKPQVAYRETITKKVTEEGRYVKQSGGRGQYGHVWIEVEPCEADFEFENKIKGGSIPREYIGPIEAGVKDSLGSGPVAGYPLINIHVSLIDGSYHEVDSSELAFKMAASIALKSATAKASPRILEPIMKIEIITPEDFIGDITADFNSRRGKISEMDNKNKLYNIRGTVPLSEMFGYSTTLRSMSQGRATYSMEPSHYGEAPKQIVESLVSIT